MDIKGPEEVCEIKNEPKLNGSQPHGEGKRDLGRKEVNDERQLELNKIKQKLNHYSDILSKTNNLTYCSVDGLDSGLPLTPDENGEIKNEGESFPNDIVTQKFGQDYFPESVIPAYYTWFQGDGSVVRYVIDFVLYTFKGDRFVHLEHLGRYESKMLMFCKVRHIGTLHTAEEIIETEHPWMNSFKNKKKLESHEGMLKVPRKMRSFSSKVVIVDWFLDVATSQDLPPCVWVVSENDVYYRIDRPSGGYYNSYMPFKMIFDLSTRIVKEMQTETDKSFKEVIRTMTQPSSFYSRDRYNQMESNEREKSEENGEIKEELTIWGSPVTIYGSSPTDIYKNLEFIFTECRYYYTLFGTTKLEKYLTELVSSLREQSPFHYFDEKFMKMEFEGKNKLANQFKDELAIEGEELQGYGHVQKALKQKQSKKGPRNKKFDIEVYNNQYSMNDKKSRSGRIIRNKAVSEIEPVVRKHVPQTESQKREEYRKAAELEAKCDGLLLPFNFDWSNYNTCSEASESDTSVPVLKSDVEVELNNAKYYPRDIPLRTLKFYGTDEIVDLIDVTRNFSVPSLTTPPLLPKMTFVQLEANLLYTSSMTDYKPSEMSSFEVASPVCICNNKRFNNIMKEVKVLNEMDVDETENKEKQREKLESPNEEEEYEDGLQWIYYLNKNKIGKRKVNKKTLDEHEIEYPEDLEEGSVGRMYVGLMGEFRKYADKYGFDLYVQNLRESGELTDKKKEVQERELGVAITDAELARDFILTNGGCMYKGRYKRFGPDPESVLPYVNSSRWNKRFKKFQRVVTVSSNYRYSTISHEQEREGFIVHDMTRLDNCPLDLIYGTETSYKAFSKPEETLPIFKKSVNVWKREQVQNRKPMNTISKVVNEYVTRFNTFVKEQYGKKLPNKAMDSSKVDPEYYKDYIVDDITEDNKDPVLGYGFKEEESLCKSELLLGKDMLTDYTWTALLKIYMFYALYEFRRTYKFKLNSVVWGDPSFFSSYQGEMNKTEENKQEKQEYTYEEDMIDTENINILEDMGYEEYENSNSGAEEDNIKEEEEEEEEEEEFGEEGLEGEEKERSTRRGWGLNRYCPYYEFEMEWYPDQEKLEKITKGKINPLFIKTIFLKLRARNYYQLDLHERLTILVWLADILTYSQTGRKFIDDRNEEFFFLKSQLMRTEDEKKGIKRIKGVTKELLELEERYLQKPIYLGMDRFYNPYYYFGIEYERRIYVQTLPQPKFIQNRIARRTRYLKVPDFKPNAFNNLSEFAQKFTQDRIFNQTKGKRGRKRENQNKESEPKQGIVKKKRKNVKEEGMEPENEQSENREMNVETTPSSGVKKENKSEKEEEGVEVKNELKDSSDITPNSIQENGVVKEEMTTPNTSDKDNTDNGSSSATPSNYGAVGTKEEEIIRKKRIKTRAKNKPKVRRSRQVFERRPTSFKTMEEYLEYLTCLPVKLSWCVIDSHKSLKRFLARLSQITINERNLSQKLSQVEQEFTLPSFEIMTYKCPTVTGEMLITMLRGVYRYFKNVHSRMVLSTVLFDENLTNENNGNLTNSMSNFNSQNNEGAVNSKEDERVMSKLERSYNNGLFMNLYLNELVKECLVLCISDVDGWKRCLRIMLELVYMFEFVSNRYYMDPRWKSLRNDWRLQLEAIHTQLQVDMMNTRKLSHPKPTVTAKGHENLNCHAHVLNLATNVGGSIISTPTGTVDIMVLIEKAALWFRMFEVYNHDEELEFPINTSINYGRFLSVEEGKYKSLRHKRDKTIVQKQSQDHEEDEEEDNWEECIDEGLFEFVKNCKQTDPLVYFPGGLLEVIKSTEKLYTNLQKTLGIVVEEQKQETKSGKSSSKSRKRKRKIKEKDKDAESESNLTDIESNLDANDVYQYIQGQEDNKEMNVDHTPNNEVREDKSEKEVNELKQKEESNNSYHNDSKGEEEESKGTSVEETPKSNQESQKLETENEGKEKSEKVKKTKKTKGAKVLNQEYATGEEEESSNEMEGTQPKKVEVEPEMNKELLISDVRLLIKKLQDAYEDAPKETTELNILSMSTNILKIKLKNKKEDEGEEHGNKETAEEPQVEILVINMLVRSKEYEPDTDEEEELSQEFGLVKNLRRMSRKMARIEKTRATKKVTEEPGFTPRSNEGGQSKVFHLVYPYVLKSPYSHRQTHYLYSYQRVLGGLESQWRSQMKCRNHKSLQQGVIRRANYMQQDVWRCVGVEWSDNKKEVKMHNPWELVP